MRHPAIPAIPVTPAINPAIPAISAINPSMATIIFAFTGYLCYFPSSSMNGYIALSVVYII